jgi:hypothetical protein
MGNFQRRLFLLGVFTVALAACNPQDQLGIGVSEDEVLPDSQSFSGLQFLDGRLLVSKAISRDIFGSNPTHYCIDNMDTKYGCLPFTSVVSTSRQPVFLRSIQFSLVNRSKMFGIAETEALTVTFPAATVITAIPTVNPDTGDFVFTRREKWKYTSDTNSWTKVVSSTDTTCVPGSNGAVGFDDRAGYALTGLHAFEEGIDYSTSLAALEVTKVHLKYFEIKENAGELEAQPEAEADLTGNAAMTSLSGALVMNGPELKAFDTFSTTNSTLPRVITGFCLRSAKKSVNNQLIRVGLFGVKGVFYKGRFR